MKTGIVLLLTLSLTACASAKQTYAPDGRVGHTLNCSGTLRNWGMCYSKAGELCGAKGYDILQQTGEGGMQAGGNSSSHSSNFALTTLHFRSMTVACKE